MNLINGKYKRALTSAQASACECAKKPRCTCRCGGALHGIGHAQYMEFERAIVQEQGYITADQVADTIAFLKGEVE